VLATKTEKLKVASVTTKALLGDKDALLKDSKTKRSQLEKELKKHGKHSKKATDEIQKLRSASKGIDLHKQQVKTLQGKVDKAKNADAKMAHAMAMVELKFKREQMSFDECEVKRKENQEEKDKVRAQQRFEVSGIQF
jgi:hypothetical protein